MAELWLDTYKYGVIASWWWYSHSLLFCPLQVLRSSNSSLCIHCLFLPLPSPEYMHTLLVRMQSNPSLVVPYLRVLPQPLSIAAHRSSSILFCLVSTACSAVVHVDRDPVTDWSNRRLANFFLCHFLFELFFSFFFFFPSSRQASLYRSL